MDSLAFQASQILDSLLQGKTYSHEDLIVYIKDNICAMSQFKALSPKKIEEIAEEYEKLYGGKTFKPGTTLETKQGYDIWFYQKKDTMSDSEHCYENRYRDYLKLNHFGENTTNYILKETEKILSLCSDPESNDKRRGLVMGDVQSGKTSNYLALANMAIDYGYKLILILAGMTDSLRIQTQERVDAGFIGAVSSSIGEKTIEYVGVGRLGDCSHYAIPLTTDKSDFEGMHAISTDFNKPQVLVVKKQKSILTNVKKWLNPGNKDVSSRNILIIDDECDNASINTKKDDDPSVINSLIRDIYNNFNCATYVGYTATPFANIFINPEKKIGNDDLFPSDFIHRLHSSPESYFGAKKVFSNSEINSPLVLLDEKEPMFLPVKHKRNYSYEGLTESLRNAICNFLICCCIRTLRGDSRKHKSMMINISPYNDIQEEIKESVQLYIANLQNIIFQYDKYPLEKFLKNAEMKRIYEIYKNDAFYNSNRGGKTILEEFDFDKIKETLNFEIQKFNVAVINNKYKGDQRFDYKKYKETGARVIVIGGFVLSRGLTLEGLMTSYFSRSCTTYDTLLQMCRWFGYRPKYEDLCRIYMSQISKDSFGAVIDAINNLDEQLETMQVHGKSPSDFGLMILESPETLETKMFVTARCKSKSSMEVIRGLNYTGVDVDTSKLYKSNKYNSDNYTNIKELCSNILELGIPFENNVKGRKMFRNVSPEIIAGFVSKLKIPPENKKFDTESISKFIKEAKYYKTWDVVFAEGNMDSTIKTFEIPYTNEKIYPVKRNFEIRDEEKIVRISKGNNRLVEPGIFNSGLDDSQIEKAKEFAIERNNRKKNPKPNPLPIATDYLSVLNRKPLLVILPVLLHSDKEDLDIEYKKKFINSLDNYLFGFAIGFSGKDQKIMLTYRINKIKQKEYMKDIEDEEDEIDD